MEMWKMVEHISRHFEIKVVVDVGSHVGGFCKKLSQPYLPKAKYFLFEPTKCNFARLVINFKNNDNVKCFNYAVLDECKTDLTIFISKDNPKDPFSGMGNTLCENVRPLHATEKQLVDGVTLNYCLEKGLIEQPDFIKIDAQGNDLNVVKGGTYLMRRAKFILMELQINILSSALTYMESIGWALYNISTEKGWVTPKGRLGEANFMFFNKKIINL